MLTARTIATTVETAFVKQLALPGALPKRLALPFLNAVLPMITAVPALPSSQVSLGVQLPTLAPLSPLLAPMTSIFVAVVNALKSLTLVGALLNRNVCLFLPAVQQTTIVADA